MEPQNKKDHIVNYKLDKSFGPAGAAAGFFLMAVGVITIFESFSGAVLIILGSFMAFSSSGCTIDFDRFRIRFTNNLFGLFRVGKWLYVSPRMKVGLSDTHMVYRVRSLSNRSVDVSTDDFRVFLYQDNGRRGEAICRFKTRERALEELARISDLLGLQVREGRHNQPPKGQINIRP